MNQQRQQRNELALELLQERIAHEQTRRERDELADNLAMIVRRVGDIRLINGNIVSMHGDGDSETYCVNNGETHYVIPRDAILAAITFNGD